MINLKKLGKIGLVVGTGALMLGATLLAGCGPSQVDYQNEVAARLAAQEVAKQQATQINVLTTEVNKNGADNLAAEKAKNDALAAQAAAELALSEKDKEVIALNEKLAQEAQVEISSTEGYLIDEIALGDSVSKTLSDKELPLFDGTVSFDDENYDVEEYFTVSDLNAAINENDMDENVYLKVKEGSVNYFVNLENTLDLSDISRDKPLTLNVLGKDVKIIDWSGDEVTFTQGAPMSLDEFESKTTVDGTEIKLESVFRGYAKFSVGSDSEIIYKGESKKVGGVDIYVKDVLYQDYAGGVHSVDIEYGADVEQTIQDGDEYAKDSPWEWTVSDHQLGLKLVESYVDVDPDEDYQALAVGKSLSLPNDFRKIEFQGLDEVSYKKVSFEDDVKDGVSYVKVRGAFTSGMDDYDRLEVDATGIYDKDLNLLGTEVEIDGTDSVLKLVGGKLVIEGVEMPIDFSGLSVDGVDVSGKDVKMRSAFGLVVSVPENVVDDKSLDLQVPEEKVFANVRVK
jgi:hypothetical protein